LYEVIGRNSKGGRLAALRIEDGAPGISMSDEYFVHWGADITEWAA
jgi:hypothetical protein